MGYDYTDRVVLERLENLARYAVRSGELADYWRKYRRFKNGSHDKPQKSAAIRAYYAVRMHNYRNRKRQPR
jgi:hypothetical protein